MTGIYSAAYAELVARELVARVELLERWHLVHDLIAAAWEELDPRAELGRAEAVRWADLDAARRRAAGLELADRLVWGRTNTDDRRTEDAP